MNGISTGRQGPCPHGAYILEKERENEYKHLNKIMPNSVKYSKENT